MKELKESKELNQLNNSINSILSVLPFAPRPPPIWPLDDNWNPGIQFPIISSRRFGLGWVGVAGHTNPEIKTTTHHTPF